jgi:hypothetical protein
MGQPLPRLRALLRMRPAQGAVAAIGLAGAGLTFLPLVGVPGYELAEAVTLLCGLLGPLLGCAAFRAEQAGLRGGATSFAPAPTPAAALGRAVGTALGAGLAAALVPLTFSTARAALGTPCDPWRGLAFFPVLVLPSLLLAVLLGVAAAAASDRRAGTWLAWALPFTGLTALTVTPLVAGPQVFAFHHLGGYFPGPLYDETVSLTGAVGWFRLQTLLLCAALAAGLIATTTREGRLSPRETTPLPLALSGLLALGAVGMEGAAPTLGFRMSDAALAERLGGVRDTAHFRIHHPRGKPRDELEHLARDLEFRREQVREFLGAVSEQRTTVWLHRSAEEKHRLVGAAATQFAKPWRGELHVNDAPFPHPVLKHELVHVLAAPFGSGPFAVTSRLGAWPNAGIIEGLAVAVDEPVGDLSLHDGAAGMRRKGLLPDVERLLTPLGFYGVASSRAYAAAGSFLRWLGELEGPERLRALYAHGDFQAVYGVPASELKARWERFLDGRTLDDVAVNLAFSRFRGESLFARPCARELAALVDEAQQELRGDPARAAELFARCAALQPDEPGHAVGRARALITLERAEDAESLLGPLSERLRDRAGLRAEVELMRADAAFGARKEASEVAAHLEQVLALSPPPATARQALLKKAALGSPLRDALWAWFLPAPDDARLALLQRALATAPADAWGNYLLGRRLALGTAPLLARPHLEAALAGSLPPLLREEALRASLLAAFLAGDCAGVRSLSDRAQQASGSLRAAAADWVQRCTFEERTFSGPLVPTGPFR